MKTLIGLVIITFLIGGCRSEKTRGEATIFLPGLISSTDQDENYLSFDATGETLFFTRGAEWAKQIPYVASGQNGNWATPERITIMDTIYNGSISPSGNQIIYSIRRNDINKSEVWLLKKRRGRWADARNLSFQSGIEGGYFQWYSESEIYMYEPANEGDLIQVKWENDRLSLVEKLDQFNTKTGCEFSPFMGPEKRFFMFTRYVEGDSSQQGVFISYNKGNEQDPVWGEEERIVGLPYVWGTRFSTDLKQFFYTDGVDIFVLLTSSLGIRIE
jgi:hypothetical protein